ncbi:uncharacterized protein PG986_009703 [Apiospora aurea]|uniref:Uncharacterized protein n=1 Tax=Apiospora aurea TaxID=335848 RepID=A0ABR1Q8F3_9PEZI
MDPGKKKAMTPKEHADARDRLTKYESELVGMESKLVDDEKSLAEAKSELDRLEQQLAAGGEETIMSDADAPDSLKAKHESQMKKVANEKAKVESRKRSIHLLKNLIEATKRMLTAPVEAPPALKPTVSKRKADDGDDKQLTVVSKRIGRHPASYWGGANTQALELMEKMKKAGSGMNASVEKPFVMGVQTAEEAIETIKSLQNPRGEWMWVDASDDKAVSQMISMLQGRNVFENMKWISPIPQKLLNEIKKAKEAAKMKADEGAKKKAEEEAKSMDTGKVVIKMPELYEIPAGPQVGEADSKEYGLVWTHSFAKFVRGSDGLKAFDHASGSVTALPVDVKTALGYDMLLLDSSEFAVSDKQAE